MKVREIVALLRQDEWRLVRVRGSHHRCTGCISTGRTAAEVEVNMREAVQGHVEEMRSAGLPIPKPTTAAGYVEVAA